MRIATQDSGLQRHHKEPHVFEHGHHRPHIQAPTTCPSDRQLPAPLRLRVTHWWLAHPQEDRQHGNRMGLFMQWSPRALNSGSFLSPESGQRVNSMGWVSGSPLGPADLSPVCGALHGYSWLTWGPLIHRGPLTQIYILRAWSLAFKATHDSGSESFSSRHLLRPRTLLFLLLSDVKVTQSCPTLCEAMGCSLSDSSRQLE